MNNPNTQSPARVQWSLCVYCGSRFGDRPEYREAATETGRLIAQTGGQLVYGGGRVGLMGAVADAALAHGAPVVGVIPDALMRREVGHAGVQELQAKRPDQMTARDVRYVSLLGALGDRDMAARAAQIRAAGISGTAAAAAAPSTD